MSITEMFERLGAPLKNIRWSWGAVREVDQTVILRVWQLGTRKIEGKRFVWVASENSNSENLGENERLEHIGLIRNGYRCLMVMCQAVDADVVPHTLQSFNKNEVFEGGELVAYEGGIWLELSRRMPVREAGA